MTDLITFDDFIAVAVKYKDSPRRNPRSVDDVGGQTCLYNGPDSDHCLAGQIFTDLGFTIQPHHEGLPIASVIDVDPAICGAIHPDHLAYISEAAQGLQEIADQGRSWQRVFTLVADDEDGLYAMPEFDALREALVR